MNDKLKQLSEHHPEMCRRIAEVYCINEYEFEFSGSGYLIASLVHIACSRQPALAWLADALKAECEKRGWYHKHIYLPDVLPHKHCVHVKQTVTWADTEAEALLDALLEVVKND